MNNKIIIFSGGTGGHVIPAVNFGNFLIKEGYNCTLILDKRGKKYSNLFKGKIYIISSSHFSGNFFFKIKSISKLILGFAQSLLVIIKFKPNNVISFGSYATLMPLFVVLTFNFFLKTNIYIHEQNSYMGKVNSLFLPFTKFFFTNFQNTKNIKNKYLNKNVHVGLPESNTAIEHKMKKIEEKDKISLFVYGGSQGSVPLINKTILMIKNLDLETIKKIYLYVQAPKLIHGELAIFFASINLKYEIKDFYKNIGYILSSSDLVITRAGAGTINDIIIHSTPAIIIPLPNSINNHQYYNAKYLSDINAAILLDEKEFNFTDSNILMNLINDKDKRMIIKNELFKINIPQANILMLSKIRNENN